MQALTPTPMKTLEIKRPVKDFARANDNVPITAITKKNEIVFLVHAYLEEGLLGSA